MALTYYKCVRPDGTDFHTGTIDYAAALASGEIIEHRATMIRDDPSTYLSVSIHPTNCTGMRWPCRLFRIEPVGRTLTAINDSKRCCHALRVIEERPAHEALGPQGEQVAALIERARALTADEVGGLSAARDAARDAAWAAARDAAWDAARDAARDAAWAAARAAARDAAWAAAWDAILAVLAVLARDLISPEQFDVLYGPWREVIGDE